MTRQRGHMMMTFDSRIYVGDYQNGNIYTYSLDVFADYDRPQRWVRSWRALPIGQNNLKRTAQHSLQLDCEVGQTDSAPSIMLRWSDDGGHTWSNEHWVTAGDAGEYGKRVIWRRLGMTQKLRDRVYEISGTDPTRIYIMGAELQVSLTNA